MSSYKLHRTKYFDKKNRFSPEYCPNIARIWSIGIFFFWGGGGPGGVLTYYGKRGSAALMGDFLAKSP